MDLSTLSDEDLLRLYQQKKSAVNEGAQIVGAKGADDNLPPNMPPWLGATMVAAGKATTRLGQGIRQMLPGDNSALDAQVAEENRLYAPLAQQHPVATMIGESLPSMAIPISGGASLAGSAFRMAAAGALPGAIEYGTPQERLERGVGGAIGGVVGAGIGHGVARIPGPRTLAANDPGNPFQIPLRLAQTTESKPIQNIDAVLQNLPFSAGVINKAKTASYEGFNRAVGEQFGADTTRITPDLLGQYQSSIGNQIGQLAGRNSLLPDQQLVSDLIRIQRRTALNISDPNERQLVSNQIGELLSHQDPNTGLIPGTLYRSWRSDIGDLAAQKGSTLGNILSDVRQSVTRAMDRSISSADAEAWALANKQYYNVNQVANAAKATPGSLSPSQLLTQVNAAQPKARFGGGNDLAKLAQYAKTTLPDQIPNSGTAQRAWYQAALTSPITGLIGAGGIGYGGGAAGIPGVTPERAAEAAAIPYIAARLLAGKPLPPAAFDIARRIGLLGGTAAGTAASPLLANQ